MSDTTKNDKNTTTYPGPERRRFRIYRTVNTEYHLDRNVCVAVRDPESGEFQLEHVALGSQLIGALAPTYSINSGTPNKGERLCFTADVLTSPLKQIERPAKTIVDRYSDMARAA